MLESLVGVILGGIITVLITIIIENLRKPNLSIQIVPPGDREYKDRPAQYARFLYVKVSNHQLPKWARWMTRNAATQCYGTITFHHLDGQNVFGRSMQVRWSGSPEPSPLLIALPDRVIRLYDPSNLITRMDIPAGEEAIIDIAAKFDKDKACFGWNNEAYFSDPVWRNPSWSLPNGRYLVNVTFRTSGDTVSEVFRLINDVSRTDFRLEPKMAEDKVQKGIYLG